jgi:hypothetical protein
VSAHRGGLGGFDGASRTVPFCRHHAASNAGYASSAASKTRGNQTPVEHRPKTGQALVKTLVKHWSKHWSNRLGRQGGGAAPPLRPHAHPLRPGKPPATPLSSCSLPPLSIPFLLSSRFLFLTPFPPPPPSAPPPQNCRSVGTSGAAPAQPSGPNPRTRRASPAPTRLRPTRPPTAASARTTTARRAPRRTRRRLPAPPPGRFCLRFPTADRSRRRCAAPAPRPWRAAALPPGALVPPAGAWAWAWGRGGSMRTRCR